MTTSDGLDLDSLISSTLDAIDQRTSEDPFSAKASVITSEQASVPGSELTTKVEDDYVEETLRRLKQAAPEVGSPSCKGASGSEESLLNMLDGLLTPESIIDSMNSLAEELELYLDGKDEMDVDVRRYRKQLAIYKEVSAIYRDNPNVLEDQTPEGDRVRQRLSELQELGSPPHEVVQKLMMDQLPSNEQGGDIAKEFESFLKEAGDGGLLPGLSKEDEEILKKLTQDPEALKNLLGETSGKPPGDCSVM
jgi:hypothetical protein